MRAPTVHVVDDDEGLRVALGRLLQTEGYEVRLHASAGALLLALPEVQDGCIVLDLEMPGPSGLDLQEALQRQGHAIPIVFLTGHGDVGSGVRAMKSGAIDFLTKPVDPATLLLAVATALESGRTASVAREEAASAQSRYDLLTPRERSVFARVVAGEPNKRIARALGITERTVKAHRSEVMAKMQAGSLVELLNIASRLRVSSDG